MALPLYLAMTAAEMAEKSALPSRLAYMACHFSPYGTGLSNCPAFLPEGSLLMLDDVTPIHGHDPDQIARDIDKVLRRSHPEALILDFQRPGYPEASELVSYLADTLPCPVVVSSLYGAELACPVLLPPVPPDVSLQDHLSSWHGREIWLEAGLDAVEIRLTEAGSESRSLPPNSDTEKSMQNRKLHCHYSIRTEPDAIRFTLFRTNSDLYALLEDASSLGVSRAVGLWQELRT